MMNDKLFNDVHNYTKYKIVEMLINKHQTKLKDINHIEQVADDVLDVLSICGLRYHEELKNEFNE